MFASFAWGQIQNRPTISVTSTGKVTAKIDVAVVFLSVRSSAPLAADALEQNKKKVGGRHWLRFPR